MKAPFVIAAVADNLAIGRKGEIPWRISADLRRFKALTMGHPVIMGRRTFESIGRPLPGRLNIVVTGTMQSAPAGVALCRSLKEALGRADAESELEAAVIGGAALYREALQAASRLEITRVRLSPEDADAFFPEWRDAGFILSSSEAGIPEGGVSFAFETWKRAAM